MPSFPATEPIDVRIDVGVGHVDLTARTTDGVEADVVPTAAASAGDRRLAEAAEVAFEQGVLRIAVPHRMNLFGRTDSVDVRVVVPEGSTVTVDTAYGSVRARGDLGDTRISAKYGTVALERVGGDLHLTAPYGDAEVAEVLGRLELVAGHGRARIGRVRGPSHVRAAHGVVDLGTTEGPLVAALSGTLTVDRALGGVDGRSAHGPIRIREAAGGTVRLVNAYAEVEVGVPHGVAAWIDASSGHGAVRNELTPDPSGADADRTVELHLRTNWADVLIRRATA